MKRNPPSEVNYLAKKEISDHDVLDTFARVAGQDVAHENVVVGMSGDPEQDAQLRRGR